MTEPVLKIATRGSRLALWQAEHVLDLLKNSGKYAQIHIVKTSGDRIQNRFLHEIGGKGLFVREIEEALLRGEADLAVHSLKDLPAVTAAPFELAAVLKRHASGDTIIFHPKISERLQLEGGRVIGKNDIRAWGKLSIGTGSLRRSSLLKQASPALELVPIRGNVDTRLQKLREGHWDALVLATASLERLPIANDLVCCGFDPEWFVPSASQGSLVIETLQNSPLRAWLKEQFNCSESNFCVQIERAVLAGLGGDCTLPVGVHASWQAGVLRCRTALFDASRGFLQGFIEEPCNAFSDALIPLMAQKVLQNLR